MFELRQGDCFDVLPTIAQGSVAMVFADLPYGVTANFWDQKIAEQPLWAGLRVASKRNAAMVLTATQPMASSLVMSNLKSFRYDLQWIKGTATGFLNAKKMPLRSHETILIFYDKLPTYNPQMTLAKKDQGLTVRGSQTQSGNYVLGGKRKPWVETGKRFPLSYLHLQSERRQKSVHPTQKPVALLEWLVSTYTNPGDLVLDPVMGSGTTGVACARLGRRFIGIEKDGEYFHRASLRIKAAYAQAQAVA